MFETIVWATDGSEHSDSALALVTELARIHHSKIVALHVDERFRGGRFGGGPVLADEDDLRRRIESQVEDLKAAGFDARLEVAVTQHHDRSALISESAVTADADLIAVGTSGYGDIESLLRGSVAKGLTHDASCPVLVIPPAWGSNAPTKAAD